MQKNVRICKKTVSYVLFLFRQEKNEKKPTQEGAFHKDAPSCVPPLLNRRICCFNTKDGNVPIPAHPSSEYLPFKRKSEHFLLNQSISLGAGQQNSAAGGFLRGRLWCRELHHSAPLKLTSLVTFLFSDKKVTYTHFAVLNLSTENVDCGNIFCGLTDCHDTLHTACGKP